MNTRAFGRIAFGNAQLREEIIVSMVKDIQIKGAYVVFVTNQYDKWFGKESRQDKEPLIRWGSTKYWLPAMPLPTKIIENTFQKHQLKRLAAKDRARYFEKLLQVHKYLFKHAIRYEDNYFRMVITMEKYSVTYDAKIALRKLIHSCFISYHVDGMEFKEYPHLYQHLEAFISAHIWKHGKQVSDACSLETLVNNWLIIKNVSNDGFQHVIISILNFMVAGKVIPFSSQHKQIVTNLWNKYAPRYCLLRCFISVEYIDHSVYFQCGDETYLQTLFNAEKNAPRWRTRDSDYRTVATKYKDLLRDLSECQESQFEFVSENQRALVCREFHFAYPESNIKWTRLQYNVRRSCDSVLKLMMYYFKRQSSQQNKGEKRKRLLGN